MGKFSNIQPGKVDPRRFNPRAKLPHGLKAEHIEHAMSSFVDFLGFINDQLVGRDLPPFEHFLMPANCSSIVGEFMSTMIPNACKTLVKNKYHNGHPDLVPAGHYEGNSILHGTEGIEVKASRYPKRWQGHNPEDTWLMVFVSSSTSPNILNKGEKPVPFRFEKVVGAQLLKSDFCALSPRRCCC